MRFGRKSRVINGATEAAETVPVQLDALASRGIEIPNYRDLTVLARGGSSIVFLAREKRLDRPVAIKVLPFDNDALAKERFAREKEIAALLGRHPFIVQVFDAGTASDGSPFLVMEYFEQGSLAERLRKEGPLPLDEALSIVEKIGLALEAAHDADILHRDVKPSNILFSQYGPALSDFGISRSMSRGEWTQSLAHFTPWHSPPEILEGDNPSVESDIYSLASTFYTMLDGQPPFVVKGDDRSLAYQMRVLRNPLPQLGRTDVSPALHDVFVKAMAKVPSDRYQSVSEFLQALRTLPLAAETAATVDEETASNRTTTDHVSAHDPNLWRAETDQTPVAPVADHDELFRPPQASPPVAAPSSAPSAGTPSLERPSFETQGGSQTPGTPFLPTSTETHAVPGADRIGGDSAAAAAFKNAQYSGAIRKATSSVATSESELPSRSSGGIAPLRGDAPLELLVDDATVFNRPRSEQPVVEEAKPKQPPFLVAFAVVLLLAIAAGAAIAFWPQNKAKALPPADPTMSSTTAPSSTTQKPPTKPNIVAEVTPESPQNFAVIEKAGDGSDGSNLSAVEVSWTVGGTNLPVAFVAVYREGAEPIYKSVDDLGRTSLTIAGLDATVPYCFWAVAVTGTVDEVIGYHSEQVCLRNGRLYEFPRQ
jgi:serine/threonine-protein kinase PknK